MNSPHLLQQVITRKRNFFFGKATTRISLRSISETAALTQPQLTQFSLSLIKNYSELIPSLETRIGDQEKIINLRGRPAESFSTRSTALAQKQEELCFIEGEISLPKTEELQDPEQLPFSLAINTRFEKITPREISHSVHFSNSGALADWRDELSATTLDKAELLSINCLRLGFEFYRTTLFGSALGSIPTISSRLYSTLSDKGFDLLVESELSDVAFSASNLVEIAIKSAQEAGVNLAS